MKRTSRMWVSLFATLSASVACAVCTPSSAEEPRAGAAKLTPRVAGDTSDPLTQAGDSNESEDVEQRATTLVDETLQLGAGVHHIRMDPRGYISTCVVVGSATISSSDSKSRAMELARQRARIDAVRHFARWLNEDVKLFETEENEYVITNESDAATTAPRSSDQLRAVRRGSDKFESRSRALVQGLELMAVSTDQAERTLSLIFGWSAATARSISRLNGNAKGSEVAANDAAGNLGENATSPGNADVEPRKVISGRALRYFSGKNRPRVGQDK